MPLKDQNKKKPNNQISDNKSFYSFCNGKTVVSGNVSHGRLLKGTDKRGV